MNNRNGLLRMGVIALAMVGFLACDKDTLQSESEPNQLSTRDINLEEECKNVCDGIILDFVELNEFDLVTEYKGVEFSAFERGNPDSELEIRVFDTVDPDICPGFNDFDLIFPDGPFGNVLVIQETNKNNLTCANDRRDGGVIRLDFRENYGTVTLNCLDLLDTEEQGKVEGVPVSGGIQLFDADDVEIAFVPIPAVEDGEAQVIDIGVEGVAYMNMVFLGSGAISNICLTPGGGGGELPLCPDGSQLLNFDELVPNVPVSMVGPVMVSAHPTPAIAFDTDDPEMCSDFDDDDMILEEGWGNVLTNQHRSRTDCANADPRGGYIAFTFPTLATVSSMDFVDVEEKGGYALFYGPGESFLGAAAIPTSEDGGTSSVAPGQEGVAKMVIFFAGSGGVDNICYSDTEEYEMATYEGCTYDFRWWKKNLGQACIDLDAEVFCDMSYRDIMTMKTRGRAYNLLAQQYVTAFLNVACNGAPFEVVEEAWTAAGDLLDDCAGVGPEADALLHQLRAFNGGLVGPDACD